ncbi:MULTISPECIES: efflux RND transporter periplasmic adaptor subunit [unclassified Pseudodesulfovibrio]|uniref:efflux RND transporter periplasmic adaptor subunit n=1 Tax=unclassified Pseudodesulfovibrio TaxID=2661612 RepID=UPI000FEBF06A|nr:MULTISPECIES: efflux RND transporter periplasmic adaptor subunit [unclassified Pseudodesulfovibrio]MCJ2165183.1 efflux RND transporter periplasmic adaptor subunit [Pseudodesulfovibrio sp. S3-i]RWU03367.1 efflux RND transporter periplasmic adaptor subunit [Pseudodesulfovibrio sp. S3]
MKWIQAIILVLMLMFTAGCGNDRLGGEAASEESLPGSTLAEAASVEVETPSVLQVKSTETFVAQSAARRSSLTGFTRARNSMTLVSEESGRVAKVLADVGDTLGKGGLFAELDTTFIQLDLVGNRTDQERLKSDLDYNKKEMDRYQMLVKNRTAAQSTLDSNIRAHQSALQQLRAKQVEERVLMERMKRFSLIGPSGWKVITRYIEPGEWITKGEKVAELGRYDVLLVPFALASEEYRALKTMGDTVQLQLTDLGVTIPAKVARVSPGFDAQSRKINVDLEITKGDFEFRGGIRTELTIDLPDPGGAVIVPKSALVKAYEEYFLMTPSGDRVRVVLLGSGDDETRRVSGSDIRPGDVFLLKP